jgi:hypothetical protein
MKTTAQLLEMNAAVSNKLDTAAPDAMRFLLQARRAVRAELEARHVAAERTVEPYRYVGESPDGFSIFEG